MNKRISTTTGIITIIVLAFIVIGGVYAYQYYYPTLKEENNEITDETADWQTYRNNKYGYEIKYPDNMFIYDALSNYDSPADQNTKIVSFDDMDEKAEGVLTISVKQKNSRPSIDEWVEEKEIPAYGKFLSLIDVDETTAVKYIDYGMVEYISVDIFKDNLIYSIIVKKDSKYVPIFDQMLSTFKFIDKKIGKLTEENNNQETYKKLNLTLGSSDGFSIQIYDKNKKLIKNVSRKEIVSLFFEKYNTIRGSINDYMGYRSIFYSGGLPVTLEEETNLVYNQSQNHIIIPIALHSFKNPIWDFFVYNIDNNQFSISSGIREEYDEFEDGAPSGGFPNELVISPEGNYIAYVTGRAGGTCVGAWFPVVVDIETLSGLKLNNSDFIEKSKNFDMPYIAKDFKWTSSNVIEATMDIGADGCGPKGKITQKVIFRLTE